jgi:hypothetical protein
MITQSRYFIRLFVCFESYEQFFSYLAFVTITGDRAVNLDLCLAPTAFSSEGPFMCHTYCDTGPLFFLGHIQKTHDSHFWMLCSCWRSNHLPISYILGLTRPALAGLELTTSRMLSESTTTRLQQTVVPWKMPTWHSPFYKPDALCGTRLTKSIERNNILWQCTHLIWRETHSDLHDAVTDSLILNYGYYTKG